MALSAFLNAGRNVASSIGRAVQKAAHAVDQTIPAPTAPVPPQAPMEPAPAPETMAVDTPQQPSEGTPAPAKPSGFALPDLGPAPSQNDPQFQGEGGPERYATAVEEWQHKKDIHDAFTELDRIYTTAHPNRDFRKEYEDYDKMRKEHEKERPKGSSLARFALALGDQNPAVRESGRSNLDEYNRSIDTAANRSDESFTRRLALRIQMHEKAAADAEQEGNWRKALREREQMALLDADAKSLQHRRDMEKVTTQQQGATERAKIRADAAKRTAQIRANTVAETHGLTGTFLTTFQKEVAKTISRYFGPKDIMRDYTDEDLSAVNDQIEQVAEILHDQQYGAGSSDTWHKTPPGKRATGETKPAGEKKTKEKF